MICLLLARHSSVPHFWLLCFVGFDKVWDLLVLFLTISPSPSAMRLFIPLISRILDLVLDQWPSKEQATVITHIITSNAINNFFWAYTHKVQWPRSRSGQKKTLAHTHARTRWSEDDGLYMVNRHVDVCFYVPFLSCALNIIWIGPLKKKRVTKEWKRRGAHARNNWTLKILKWIKRTTTTTITNSPAC